MVYQKRTEGCQLQNLPCYSEKKGLLDRINEAAFAKTPSFSVEVQCLENLWGTLVHKAKTPEQPKTEKHFTEGENPKKQLKMTDVTKFSRDDPRQTKITNSIASIREREVHFRASDQGNRVLIQ